MNYEAPEALVLAQNQECLPASPCVAVVANPVASGAKHLYEQVKTLVQSESYVPGSIYHTLPGGLEANRPGLLRLLAKGAGKNSDGTTKHYDAIAILGGDGAGDMVANFLGGDPDLPEELRGTVMIEADNGGASDGHKARFGKGDLDLAQLGGLPIVNVHPLRVETTTPSGEKKVERGPLYWTLGSSARVAEWLNSPANRNSPMRRFKAGKWLQEHIAGAYLVLTSPSFTIVEDGQERTVYETLISNNSRMANHGGFPGDGRKESLSVLEVTSKRQLIRLAARLLTGRVADIEWQHRDRLHVTVQRPPRGRQTTPSQRGGETDALAPGSVVRATKDPTPLRYASTLLAA